ncbi:hypothetical protein [Salinibacterium sp. NK8237]|uniref:hypothetical protein n=1 Tax=Salinibacterium sp. NK8237 TaxID=2792038 RepID=UPI0018CE827A|nr:hypothetical protein [Salinibacterium sp. NK8237]MBH0130545.1 hypothetical protein [Salinibacterium sp. NK8237]
MFWFWGFLAIGIATGVALSGARTPVISLPRILGVTAVSTSLALLILFNSTASAEHTFVYASSLALAEMAWTARTWGRIFPESGLRFHQVLLDELVAPNRIRIAYAQLLVERKGDPLAADAESPVEAEGDPSDTTNDPHTDDPDTDDPDASPPPPPAPRGFPT